MTRRAWLARAGDVWALLLVAAALWFHLPGRMSPDSVMQLTQARSGAFSDDHPPVMAVLWRLLDAIAPGPMGVVVPHIVVFAAACLLLARRIDEHPLVRPAIFTCLFLFLPTFLLLGIAWKDISFLATLTLAMALLYSAMLDQPSGGKPDWRILGGIALVLWYAIGVRYNGIFAVFPLAVWGVWLAMRKTTQLLRFAGGAILGAALCLAVFASHSMLGRLLGATPTSFWQVSAVYDLTAISLATGEDRLDDDLFPGSSLEEMATYFRPYSGLGITQSAPFYRTLSAQEDLARLRDEWLDAMAEQPVAFVAHRSRVLTEAMGFTALEPWVPVLPDGVRSSDIGPSLSETSFAANTLHRVDRVARHTYAYRPWLHVIFVGVVLAMLYAVRSDRRGLLTIVAVVAVANYASIFLLAHSPDFRFSLPMLFASALALALGLREGAQGLPGLARRLAGGASTRLVLAQLGRAWRVVASHASQWRGRRGGG